MIADSHEITRMGIRKLFEKNRDLKIIATAGNDEEIYRKIEKYRPDVVIMDNNFATVSCSDVAEYSAGNFPECKVLCHPSVLDEKRIMKGIESGVSGFVPKGESADWLPDAIRTVHGGNKFLKGTVADIFVDNYFKEKKESEILESVRQVLTEKEIEILRNLSRGMSYKQVAEISHIGIRTAAMHIFNIRKKLKTKNIASLVKYAIRNKITAI